MRKGKTATGKNGGMSEEALEARRAYRRKWNREHKDLVRQAQARYWQKQAEKYKAAKAAEGKAEE